MIKEEIPAGFLVVAAVFCILWLPIVAVVAVVQKRSIGLAILFGMLLGPFGLYLFPRLPPKNPRSPGW